MTLQIRFDQVAAVYDAQRAHPPAVSAQLAAALSALLGPGPCLELGVGTGRIAIPAALAGVQIVGLDVSAGMLATAALRAREAGVELPLARGDAQQLPLADRSLAGVLAVHVLHLLPDWRGALAEIVRVLQPGGLLIQGADWRDPDSCVGLLRGRLRLAVLELLPGSRPPGAGAAVAQALARYGGSTAEPITAARWTRSLSPREVIAGMEARLDAETWALPEDLLQAAVAAVRAWAEHTWPDLDAPQEVEHRFTLTVTSFSPQAAQQ